MNKEFKKSTFCGECECGCVEVKMEKDKVYIRSTFKKDTIVEFTNDEWEVFIKGVKAGEFDIKN